MTRFFFDYATEGQLLHDYRGDEFRDVVRNHCASHPEAGSHGLPRAVFSECLGFTADGRESSLASETMPLVWQPILRRVTERVLR